MRERERDDYDPPFKINKVLITDNHSVFTKLLSLGSKNETVEDHHLILIRNIMFINEIRHCKFTLLMNSEGA